MGSKIGIIALFVLTLGVSFGQSPSTNEISFFVKSKLCTYNVPNNWMLDSTGTNGTTFFIYSEASDPNDKFRENVNLLVQDLSQYPGMNLEKYTEISVNQIKNMITESNLEISKTYFSKPRPYQHVIYTGKQGMFKLKFEQYYFISDNKAYVLTYTSEEKNYLKYLGSAQIILNSFRIK